MYFTTVEEHEKEIIMNLYHAAIVSEGCTWSEQYPNEEIMLDDLRRSDLYCMKTEEGEIIGAISVDDDPAVEKLDCWTTELKPGAELARLVVKESYRNQSIARELLNAGMQLLKERGYRSVHFLVSPNNKRAVRSYAKLEFTNRGDADLFGEHWWCYEKAL